MASSSLGSPATGHRSWRPQVARAFNRHMLDRRNFPCGSHRNKFSIYPTRARAHPTPPPICVYSPYVRAYKSSVHPYTLILHSEKQTRHPLRSYMNYTSLSHLLSSHLVARSSDNRFSFLCSLYQQPPHHIFSVSHLYATNSLAAGG